MNKKNHIYHILLSFGFLASVVFLTGFSSNQTDEPIYDQEEPISNLVQKEVDKKLAIFKKNIIERCTKNAIDNAEIFIDSIVAEEIKLQRNDTIAFPSRPERPNMPQKIILNDSTGIKPILDN